MPRAQLTAVKYDFITSYGEKYPDTGFIGRQAAKVLDLIKRDGRVTRLTAMHYGIANLTARISELRLYGGLDIVCTEKVDAVGRRYGEWTIGPTTVLH